MSNKLELKKLTEFPGELIDEKKVPIFCAHQYAVYLKQVKLQDVFWFAGYINVNIICIVLFSIIKKVMFKGACF